MKNTFYKIVFLPYWKNILIKCVKKWKKKKERYRVDILKWRRGVDAQTIRISSNLVHPIQFERKLCPRHNHPLYFYFFSMTLHLFGFSQNKHVYSINNIFSNMGPIKLNTLLTTLKSFSNKYNIGHPKDLRDPLKHESHDL
jgi:hypothetical protein